MSTPSIPTSPYTKIPDQCRISNSIINDLQPASQECIRNLLRYRPEIPYNPATPRTAAVFIGLFESNRCVDSSSSSFASSSNSKADSSSSPPTIPQLHILLTTRSSSLRTHAGQTALPGGKCDSTDVDTNHTARREAWEEIGLMMDEKEKEQERKRIWKVGEMEPFMSKYGLIVYRKLKFPYNVLRET